MTSPDEFTPDEAAEIFGKPVDPIPPDAREMELALVLRRIRSLLIDAAADRGVGVKNLAARLDVSPSVVSRMLRSEGDMRVSTAVEWAYALGFAWDFNLREIHTAAARANFFAVTPTLASVPASATELSEIRPVELARPAPVSQASPVREEAVA